MADNLPEPRSRKESYLAKAAGMSVSIPEKAESREEQYLAAIAEGGGGGGGGTTYTAGDGIVIANDAISVDLVQATGNSTKKVMSQDAVTQALASAGGDSVITLTSADYNYPIDNPTRVSLWDKESGFYTWANGVRVAFSTSNSTNREGSALVFNPEGYYTDMVQVYPAGEGSTYTMWKTVRETGAASSGYSNIHPIITSNIVQSTGTSTANIMSQKAVTDALNALPTGGGMVELTSADYNYHSSGDTDDGIAIWLLEPGAYKWGAQLKTYTSSAPTSRNYRKDSFLFVIAKGGNAIYFDSSVGFYYSVYMGGDGSSYIQNVVLDESKLKQAAGGSFTDVMSQLAITSMVYADPSTLTRIRIGGNISSSSGTNNIVIGDGASSSANQGVIIGKSASGRGDRSIAIGGSATTNRTSGTYTHARNIAIGAEAKAYGGSSSLASQGYAIAIGSNAYADYKGSIALGAYSSPASNGVMDIGSSSTAYGYNSTNYRLLSGVHDGQGLHDAATVAQGNTLATSAPTTATVGVLGQLYTDTTNMHTYQLTAIDTADPDNPSYTWTQRW